MEDQGRMLEYYKIIRSSLNTFDDIIVKLVLQGSTIVIAMLTASLYAFDRGYKDVSIVIIIGAIILTVALFAKLWIYTDILQIGISTAIKVERKVFSVTQDAELKFNISDPKKNIEYRLTENLRDNPKNKLGKLTKAILRGIYIVFLLFDIILLIFISCQSIPENKNVETIKPSTQISQTKSSIQ